MAIWYGGSREGAQDVQLYKSIFRKNEAGYGHWYNISPITSPGKTQQDTQRYVRKVGNPVIAQWPNGELWIIYVTTSMGGWAASNLNLITSTDNGAHWSPAKRLVTSPFFNLSTLVKGAPFFYADGSLGVPVYHEFAGKFGEILRIARNGTILDKQRLSVQREGIQPVVLIEDQDNATALLRYSGNQVPPRALKTHTASTITNWAPSTATEIPNPNSAIAALTLKNDRFLAVLNDTDKDRERLSLMLKEGKDAEWKRIYTFEDQYALRELKLNPEEYAEHLFPLLIQNNVPLENIDETTARIQKNMCRKSKGRCEFQFDYPYLIQATDGTFHLFSTWNKTLVSHIEFTEQWLETLP